MKRLLSLILLPLFLILSQGQALGIKVSLGIDHGSLDTLLSKYVNDSGLVDYKNWKENSEDLKSLDAYLARFAPEPETPARSNDLAASLINAYNAFIIRWILANYPTESIRLLDKSWKEKRHKVGGAYVSLDDIEHEALRPLIGWKAHAVIVCAARSCPPLQAFAYKKESLDQQIEESYRKWLSRRDLNHFSPGRGRIHISKIFDWFEKDFRQAGSVTRILARYAPEKYRRFLQKRKYKIKYKPYHWGLNDQSSLGKDYRHSIFHSLF